MVDSLRGKDSVYRSGLPCPRCGRSLLPVPAERSITFHCKSGHELQLPDLLSAQSSTLRGGLETLLTEWRLHRQTLFEIVEVATRNGHLKVAEIFQRHANTLERRIHLLQSSYPSPDLKTSSMTVPDSPLLPNL